MKKLFSIFPGLLLMAAMAVNAQYTYTTNNGGITITAYNGPSGAVNIPATLSGLPVTGIQSGFFDYSMISVTIPGSVTNIGGGAFGTCVSLNSIYIMGNAPVASASAFSMDSSAIVYHLPGTTGWNSTLTGRPVELLPFVYTTNQSAISLTGYNGAGGSIGIPAAIAGLPVTSIGTNAFASDTNLTLVIIPENVLTIGSNAFCDCTNLAAVTLPYSLTSIGQYAFAGASLATISIPGSVTNLGDYAFQNCVNLTNVYFTGNAPSADPTVFIGDNNAAAYYLPATAGWNATYAGLLTALWSPYTFNAASGTITRYSGLAGPVVNIPAAINGAPVTTIGPQAFEGASLTSVTIPGSVTFIYSDAFQNCVSLTNVYFTGNAPTPTPPVFTGNANVTAFYFPGTTGWSSNFAGIPAVLFNPYLCATNAGGITITGYNGPAGATISIPATLNGLPVTSIGPNAFSGSSLAGVTFPSSVTSIGSQAFANSSLTSVTMPGSIASIGSQAFSSCASLTSAYFIGNAPTADSTVYSGDNNVAIYYLIGTTGWNSIFAGLSTLPWNPYTFITNNAGAITITGYSGLAAPKIIIPAIINGLPVTSIGMEAFESSGLTSVTIPTSITNISSFAFSSCYSLTNIYFAGNAPTASSSVFSSDNKSTVYYLPGATGWNTPFAGRPAVLWNPQPQTGAPSFGVLNHQFGFNLVGPTNLVLVVEACTNLANPVWMPLQTVNLGSSGSFYFSEPFQTNAPGRYYRLSSL